MLRALAPVRPSQVVAVWLLSGLAVITVAIVGNRRNLRPSHRPLTTFLILAETCLYLSFQLHKPLICMFTLTAVSLYLCSLWGWFNVRHLNEANPTPPPHVTASAWGLVALWVLCLVEDASGWPARYALTGAALSVAWSLWRQDIKRHLFLKAMLWLLCLLPLISRAQPTLLIVPAMLVILWWSRHIRYGLPVHEQMEDDNWMLVIFEDPAKALVVTFLLGGVVGGVVLSLPIASDTGSAHHLLDGLFTSISAICVTGLAVLDTPVAFTSFGEAVILLLIQLGGLGIMTFSTAALLILGRRLSMRYELTAASLLNTSSHSAIRSIIRNVFTVTIVCESSGALLLTFLFRAHGDAWGQAIWRATFTSISAFCNAGFALQSDSLVPYNGDPVLLSTVACLIILGGLGPLVILNLIRLPLGERLAAQSKLILVTAGILLAIGFVGFSVFETRNSLAGMGFGDRVANAFFQSATLRTAGFNSVDLTTVAPATYVLMLPLMFIGGSPASTAGGIKTTTIAVLILLIRAAFQGRDHISFYGYQIRSATVFRAATVTVLGLVAVAFFFVGILLTQDMSMEVGFFETVSALGTVGLSLGGTARLDEIGKIIIMTAMFAGRVGPLTLLLVLPSKSRGHAPMVLPETDLDVG